MGSQIKGVSQQSPWKPGENNRSDIFKGHPEQRYADQAPQGCGAALSLALTGSYELARDEWARSRERVFRAREPALAASRPRGHGIAETEA